jgi:hypothetical protein
MPVLHFAPGIHHDKLFCGSQDHAHSIRTAILGWAAPWMGEGRGAPQRPCPAPARGPGCSAGGAAIQASSSRRTCIPTRRRRKHGPTQRHRQLWTDISPRGQATAVRGGALFRGPGETNPPGHSSHRHHEYCLLPPLLLVLVLLQVAHRSARVGCGRVNELQGGERTRLAVYQLYRYPTSSGRRRACPHSRPPRLSHVAPFATGIGAFEST